VREQGKRKREKKGVSLLKIDIIIRSITIKTSGKKKGSGLEI